MGGVLREMSQPVKLQIDHVSKWFEGKDKDQLEVLRDVSVTVQTAECYTLIGHSGCGKTTLLNIVAGLELPTSGQIVRDGQPCHEPGQDRGMVFQSYSLFPWLTVRGNIEFGPKIRKMPASERKELAEHHLNLVQLSKFADSYPKELSGGMQQRVALARALANRPEILLMDEPFGALDAETREDMQDLFGRVREHEGVTVLFITHDVDEAIVVSDRIGLMGANPGCIVEEYTVNLTQPRRADVKITDEFLEIKRDFIQRFKTA